MDKREVDEVICLEQPSFFSGVGQLYEDFEQVEDDLLIGAEDVAGGQASEHGVGDLAGSARNRDANDIAHDGASHK